MSNSTKLKRHETESDNSSNECDPEVSEVSRGSNNGSYKDTSSQPANTSNQTAVLDGEMKPMPLIDSQREAVTSLLSMPTLSALIIQSNAPAAHPPTFRLSATTESTSFVAPPSPLFSSMVTESTASTAFPPPILSARTTESTAGKTQQSLPSAISDSNFCKSVLQPTFSTAVTQSRGSSIIPPPLLSAMVTDSTAENLPPCPCRPGGLLTTYEENEVSQEEGKSGTTNANHRRQIGAVRVDRASYQDIHPYDNLMFSGHEEASSTCAEDAILEEGQASPLEAMRADDWVASTREEYLATKIPVCEVERNRFTPRDRKGLGANRMIQLGLVLFIVAIAVTVIFVIVVEDDLKNDHSTDANYTNPSSALYLTRTVPLAPGDNGTVWDLLAERSVSVLYPYGEYEDKLNDKSSYQYQAYEWIAEDQLYDEKWRDPTILLERYALAVFYYSTNGPNWNFAGADDWLDHNTDHCTDWSIVHSFRGLCEEGGLAPGGVRFLLLDSASLVGTIPPELGLLSHMQRFSLVSNKLTGSIPHSLGLLWNIENFSVSDNFGLSGTLPATLGNMEKLAKFSVAMTSVSGNVPTEYEGWTQVNTFEFYSTNLVGKMDDGLCNHFEARYENAATNGLAFRLEGTCAQLECSCCTSCCTDNPEFLEVFDTYPLPNDLCPPNLSNPFLPDDGDGMQVP